MKDIEYFLLEEEKYKETPEPEMEYIEGYGFEEPYEPLSFLREGIFKRLAPKAMEKDGECGLSNVQWLILFCFLDSISVYFRDDTYYDEIPEIVKEMQEILDSVIVKAPKFSGNTLFRFLKDHDKRDFIIGEIFCPKYSLTTTTDNWGKDDTYIITPLASRMTKAHALYKFYNKAGENQVNFERGAKFKVTKIIENRSGNKLIYFDEIG